MGVATDLTQFQESIEDVEMGAIHALLGNDFLHSLLHAGTDRLVEIALGSFKLDRAYHLGLGRQLCGHLRLLPSQHERADAAS